MLLATLTICFLSGCGTSRHYNLAGHSYPVSNGETITAPTDVPGADSWELVSNRFLKFRMRTIIINRYGITDPEEIARIEAEVRQLERDATD